MSKFLYVVTLMVTCQENSVKATVIRKLGVGLSLG